MAYRRQTITDEGIAMIDTLLDGKETISECWRSIAERAPHKEAVVHYVAGEEPYRWTWGNILRVSSLYARALKDHGIRKGDICAIIIRHNGVPPVLWTHRKAG